MIVFLFGLAGAGLGAMTARRRKGNALDMVQYAAGYAIAFMLVGLFLLFFLSHQLG